MKSKNKRVKIKTEMKSAFGYMQFIWRESFSIISRFSYKKKVLIQKGDTKIFVLCDTKKLMF